jgi:glycosyltransferase involved in cell wall biosynthesis
MKDNRRLKILVSAYACSPYCGSEPGNGWGFVKAIAQLHDVWVITEQKEFLKDISKYIAEHRELERKINFKYIPRNRKLLLEKFWPPAYYWTYRRWHQDAFVLAQKLHREIGFDLAHQLNMTGFREPGYLWQLGIPFVWGPIGGMGYFPWRLLPVVGGKGARYYLGYNLMNFFHIHFLSRPRRAAKAAINGLLAATPENQTGALAHWGCRSTVVCEVGLPGVVAETIPQRLDKTPLRLVWTGLHIHRKALNLALRALSLLPQNVNWELHVLGEGQMTDVWKNLAEQLRIDERCFFHGWLSRHDALDTMSNSHVMLFTSLRDLTATVTIEALSLGLPIICLDHCGFAHVVNERCGIKVPVTTSKEIIKGLTAAVERLAGNEDLRRRLAEGALVRAQDFAWERKAEVVDRIYAARIREADSHLKEHE